MNPHILLGLKLKSDEIIEYIEYRDLKIWYDIDTLYENIPDVYWIQDFKSGIEIRANETQLVDTIFLHLRDHDDYKKFNLNSLGMTILDNSIQGLGKPTKTGTYNGANWIRYDLQDYSIHYLWDDNGPKTLSFIHPSAIP